MLEVQSLQYEFLHSLCKAKSPVFIYLVNGIKLHGYIESFDSDVVFLGNSIKQMVYKHAISTITPVRSIPGQEQHDGAIAEH